MLQIFCIFHKSIVDECYSQLTDEELSYITFIAVNETIPKEYSTTRPYKFIKEWELPQYIDYHNDGIKEASVLFHVYRNKLHEQYKWIGFCHYDMIFKKDSINNINKLIRLSDINDYISLHNETYTNTMHRSWFQIYLLAIIEREFPRYFELPLNRENTIPLFNAFIVHKNLFKQTVEFGEHMLPLLYPICVNEPNRTDYGNFSCTFERVFGLVLAHLGNKIAEFDVIHDSTIRV
jgi:hypothetical protein